MKTIAFCFAALFASTIAAPALEGNGFENEDRIVGGKETKIQNHPYVVSLRFNGKHRCGGSVLTRTRGLSAAQCFSQDPPASSYQIMAGSTTLAGDANQQLRPLSQYYAHPGFNRVPHQSDLAILFWKEPLTFGDYVRPVNLAAPGANPDFTKPCNVSGWGATREGGPLSNILRTVSNSLVDDEVCNGTSMYNGQIAYAMLCAGLPEGGRDSCDGDNGGPLVVDNRLFGVKSWGRGCGRPNSPGVYTVIEKF